MYLHKNPWNINAWVLWLKYDLKEQVCNLKKYWTL